MRIAYLDCFSGISGDMVLGALLDAGVSREKLEAGLRRLPVSGWSLEVARVRRGPIAATQVVVRSDEQHPHRSLQEILRLIEAADLPAPVQQRAAAIFRRLGEAEAHVHDIPVERVHFHEVGAVDALVDIVGAAIGFELAGVDQVIVSPLNLGGGRVRAAHGWLPVPAPATAELVRGLQCYSTGIAHELVTPTGAAIAATLASGCGPLPAMQVDAVGWGAGSAELAEQPNVLRLFLGEQASEATGREETIMLLEATVDDMNPQLYAHLVERALAAGALDVWAVPVYMKKNRPGELLTVLCPPEAAERLVELLFCETTTLGVRQTLTRRRVLDRDWVTVSTAYGPVRIKIARLGSRVVNAAPEFDDCRRLAEQTGLPLKEILAEAMARYRQQSTETAPACPSST
jgi:uncharacterized protein (TIGR00299 family) protein